MLARVGATGAIQQPREADLRPWRDKRIADTADAASINISTITPAVTRYFAGTAKVSVEMHASQTVYPAISPMSPAMNRCTLRSHHRGT